MFFSFFPVVFCGPIPIADENAFQLYEVGTTGIFRQLQGQGYYDQINPDPDFIPPTLVLRRSKVADGAEWQSEVVDDSSTALYLSLLDSSSDASKNASAPYAGLQKRGSKF